MDQETNNAEIKIESHSVVNLYSGVRGLAIKILNRIDRTDAYLERMLDNEMKGTELSGPDKALFVRNSSWCCKMAGQTRLDFKWFLQRNFF